MNIEEAIIDDIYKRLEKLEEEKNILTPKSMEQLILDEMVYKEDMRLRKLYVF